MASKFDSFAFALRELCRQHHLVIGPTPERTIGVWSTSEGADPVTGLDDRTGTVMNPPEGTNLPPYFLTVLAAQQYPGYVGHEDSRVMAETLAAAAKGSCIVQIGSNRHVRGWAVIAH